jgi:tetratricopeptide (TPR) repeat protein
MNEWLSARYYRLALSAASRRDISGAARYAYRACLIGGAGGGAFRLLGLCLYELGEPEALRYFSSDSPEQAAARKEFNRMMVEWERIRVLVDRKKWRKAIRRAEQIPCRNVRVLNLHGCLLACAGRYGEAARFFAEALEKDRGNRLASAGLTEALNRRKKAWWHR